MTFIFPNLCYECGDYGALGSGLCQWCDRRARRHRMTVIAREIRRQRHTPRLMTWHDRGAPQASDLDHHMAAIYWHSFNFWNDRLGFWKAFRELHIPAFLTDTEPVTGEAL